MRRILGAYTFVMLLVLYAPILVMVLFSFNESKYQVRWVGFTLSWYGKLFGNREIGDALQNTLVLAVTSAAGATVLG
ncbi:MAG: ABC transporter permease, partial [Planctomycetes bacterium]|nr:ABC transporter permease [Planctomycetota bacterium]